MSFQISQVHTRKGFHVDFYNQWPDLFRKCGWYDFTVLNISGEWTRNESHVEVTIGLMGISMTVVYVYNDHFARDLAERLKDAIEKEHGDVEIKDPNGVLDEISRRERES